MTSVVIFLFQLSHVAMFAMVIFILLTAYGVFMHMLLFPPKTESAGNEGNPTGYLEMLFKIYFRPYLLLFADLGLEKYECKSLLTSYTCYLYQHLP